jgi:hypothetical protein
MYVTINGAIRVGDKQTNLLDVLNAALAFLENEYPQIRHP